MEDRAPVAVASSREKASLLIGTQRRTAGLRLRATGRDWVYGAGPEVLGPLISGILAMTGHSSAHRDLWATAYRGSVPDPEATLEP